MEFLEASYIYNWTDIQNIVVDKPFHKFALDTLGANEQDICELLDPDMCEKTMHCILYKPNKCVSKKRTYSMHKPSINLKSKSGADFAVVDSMYLSRVQLMNANIDMYYCAVKSLQTNVIYVLFSSGIVLTQTDLQENSELNANLHLLIAKLSGASKKYQIVLGGHSMGCVLALYTGFLMQKVSTSMFHKCFFVGTAGAKWIPSDISFANLPNVKIFISGELRHSKTKDTLLLDCFINEGDRDLVAYKPLTVLYYDTNDRTAFSIDIDKITYEISYPDKSTSQCKKFHMWTYYYGLINELYKDVEPSSTITLQPRNQRKSSTQYRIVKNMSRSYTKSNKNSLL